MKLTLRLLALLGILLFGTLFAFTFGVPESVERIGADFIKQRIEQETREKIDSLTLKARDSKLGKLVTKVLENQQERVEQLKTLLKTRAQDKIAEVVARMQNLDCECRRKVAEMISKGLKVELSLATAAVAKIEDFLQGKYLEVTRKLTTDVRIFLGCNLAAFLLLGLASLCQPKAVAQLFVPALLVVLTVVICSYFYLFQQNWFLTILYSDYVGFGYLAWLGAVFALCCDIIINRARVCTSIVNGMLRSIGSGDFVVVPC